MSALVVGEALIDEVVEPARTSRHPGGSPANVALGLARLGVATRLHTALGDDVDGEVVRRHMAGSGVVLTPESVTATATSKAIATLAADGSATYEFALDWNPRQLGDLGSPTIIHTGSLGALLDPGAGVTSGIVHRGRAAGALITFDPNVRPSLVPDSPRTHELFRDIAFSSHVVKMSDEDAAFLFPGTALPAVLDLLLAAGVAVAGITRGSRGAYLGSGRHRVVVPPLRTTVADTVGAGDSFMAALVWALVFAGDGWDGHPLPESRLVDIGRTAATAAALTVSRPGADLPTLTDLTAEETRA